MRNKKINMKIKKQVYITPQIQSIIIDSEINLTLDSTPPEGPNELTLKASPNYFTNDPFKINLG